MSSRTKSISGYISLLVVVFISGITLLVQSCKKDDDHHDKDSTDQPWGDMEHPFPIYTIDDFTYAVKKDGTLWARGGVFSNTSGDGYIQVESTVKKLANTNGDDRLYVLRKDNSVWRSTELPSNSNPEFANQKATEKITENAKDVQKGSFFAVILKSDGTAWAIGENGTGEFGLGTSTYDELPLTQIGSNVKQVAAGYSNIYLLKNDHSLWSAGDYIYGKLGYPSKDKQRTFKKVMDDVEVVRADGNVVMVVKKDRSAWSFGSNVNGVQGIGEASQDPTYPHKIADAVKDVFPMGVTSYFVKEDGTLWASGSNTYGEMGMESPKRSLNFIKVAENVSYISTLSSAHHIVILQNGKYKMAGRNDVKQLQQSDVGNFTSFVDFEMP